MDCSLFLKAPNTAGEMNKIQSYIVRMENWAETNELKFNRDECKGKIKCTSIGWDIWLGSSTCEKDLGILADYKLNLSQQCDVSS